MSPFVSFIILAVFVILLFIIGFLISLAGQGLCVKKPCIEKANFMVERFNFDIDPCENFYKFVCKKVILSSTEKLEKNKLTRLVNILKKPMIVDDNRIIQIAKQVYSRCIDEKQIEEEGTDALLIILAKTGGFPLIERTKNEWYEFSYRSWNMFTAEYTAYDNGFGNAHFYDSEAKLDLSINKENPTTFYSVPAILKGVEQIDKYIKHYESYVWDLYNYFNTNGNKTESIKEEVNKTVHLKKCLLEIANLPSDCSKNTSQRVFNQADLSDLIEQYPFVYNKKLAKNSGELNFWSLVGMKASGRKLGLHNKIVFSPGFEEYLTNLEKCLKKSYETTHGKTEVKKYKYARTLANYVAIEHIIQVTPFLPINLRYIYNNNLNQKGSESTIYNISRQFICAKKVKDQINTAFSSFYITDYYIIPNKTELSQVEAPIKLRMIAERIVYEANNFIKKVNWMDETTKTETVRKIKNMFHFALPSSVISQLKNKTLFDSFYCSMCLNEESTLDMYLSLNVVKTNKNFVTIDPKVEWKDFNEEFDVLSTNIYYDEVRDIVVIPLGVLDFPVFYVDWPQYINYGGVGSKMAKEFVKAINFAGSKYSLFQEYSWTNFTKYNYKYKQKCFMNQYNNYIHNFIKQDFNDSKCAEEIISDLASVELAIKSYNNFEKSRFYHEPRLPKMEKFNSQQNVFINYAAFFCTGTTDDKVYYKGMSEKDIGNPSSEYRVIGSLKNFKEFSNTFNCKPGSLMNPIEKCDVFVE